ncbi:ganglioside GM2 activator-like [Glandiceps talaboti]
MNITSLIFVVSLIWLGSNTVIADFQDFTWQQCGGRDITVSELSISPMPLASQSDVEFAYNLTVDELMDGTTVDVTLKKIRKIWGFEYKVKVPCIRNIGSCSYDLCDVVEYFGKIECLPTPNDVCQCPPPSGLYQGDRSFYLGDELEHVAPIINGNYEVTIHVRHPGGNLAGCLKAELSLDVESIFG